jgi:amino acid exporter
MIKVLFSGIGVGIALSFLTGPVFFALVKTSIEKGFRAGASLATGVFMSDAGYILIAIFGAKKLELSPPIKLYMGIFGSLFLIAIGTFYLLKKKAELHNSSMNKSRTGYFFKGFLMNTLNPFVLVYWISVISLLALDDGMNRQEMLVFFSATLLTILSSDMLKAYISSRIRHMISPVVLLWMNRIAGIALLIFGLQMLIRVF